MCIILPWSQLWTYDVHVIHIIYNSFDMSDVFVRNNMTDKHSHIVNRKIEWKYYYFLYNFCLWIYKLSNFFNHISGVMVSMLDSKVVDHGFEPLSVQTLVGSNQRLINWYLLLLRKECSIKEKEQRLICSESG